MIPIEEYLRSPAMTQLLSEYKSRGNHQRLGQFFVNHWIVGPWDFLYYHEEPPLCKLMIAQWLQRYHYYDTLPPVVRKFN